MDQVSGRQSTERQQETKGSPGVLRPQLLSSTTHIFHGLLNCLIESVIQKARSSVSRVSVFGWHLVVPLQCALWVRWR
ncbi:hypothetical protein SRHO_G00071160 [Serrasalmus rhombeus]